MPGITKLSTNSAQLGKRISAIDGLRGVAILMVMLYHADSWIPGRPDTASIHPINLLKFGYSGVDLFFVLSGFSLYYAWLYHEKTQTGNRISSYYQRRFWRIYPPYFIAFLIPFILSMDSDVGWLKMEFISHILLIQNFSIEHFYGVNGPLWSIAVEAQFYLVFPLIVYLFDKFGALKTVLAIVFISFLYRYAIFLEFSDLTYRQVPKPYLQGFLLARIPNFVLGMFLAANNNKIDKTAKFPRDFLMGIALMGGTWISIYFFRNSSMIWREFGFALSYSLLVLGILRSTHLSKLMNSGWLLWIGIVSYSVYLTHAPIIMWCNKLIGVMGLQIPKSWILWIILVSLYFVLCLLVGKVFYNLIEKKAFKMSRKFAI